MITYPRTRFLFGKNWKSYSNYINEERIGYAEEALRSFLGDTLSGRSFIDVGSGSGIHSLCAKRMKADRIFSFDYDIDSVECTKSLKDEFYPDDPNWIIHQGSVLDKEFIAMTGKYDIVYSWGVLHHTGRMWEAIENTISLTNKDGLCFIAIYNDQGYKSQFWWCIKYVYNKLPGFLKNPYALFCAFFSQFINIMKYTILLRPIVAIDPLINYKKQRGMGIIHDWIDWIGGFPYEYASLSQLNAFFSEHGFEVLKSIKSNSLGCHQVLYKRRRHDIN